MKTQDCKYDSKSKRSDKVKALEVVKESPLALVTQKIAYEAHSVFVGF